MNKLDKRHYELIKSIIHRQSPRSKIFVFGSRAEGTSRKNSDLDLAVCGCAPLSFQAMMEIREDFENSSLPFLVDVVDWRKLDPQFKKMIEDKGVIDIESLF